MFSFLYSPNRTSRVLDVEIDTRQRGPGLWDADCKIYEQVAGRRLLLAGDVCWHGIAAGTEDECLDEVEMRLADDIEHGRTLKL